MQQTTHPFIFDTSPNNGGQSDSLQVELTWEPTTDFDLGDTVSYQVELGESINSLISVYNGTETVFTTEELLDNIPTFESVSKGFKWCCYRK